jgi:putative membrane protein
MTEPDYRFSLANERTYLAWVRTGLALIAGGIGLRVFAPEGNWVLAVTAIGATALGGLLSVMSLLHWQKVERAMTAGEPLPTQRGPLILTIGMVAITLLVALGLLL